MDRTSARISRPLSRRGKTNAKVVLLAAGEGCDECVDFLLIRPLAAGVDARAGGVTDPQYNLVRPRRIVDQHRGRIKGIEIPTLVEWPIDQIDGRARGPTLAWPGMITRPRLIARRIAMPSLGCIIAAPCSRSPPMPTSAALV
jgi:hypothetical protein